MSSFSLPGMHRTRARSHGRLRWVILLSAAVAAVMWRTQTAISSVPRRSRSAIDEFATGMRHRLNGVDSKASVGPAVVDRPSSEEAGTVIEAGEDRQGTFRPTRVEPDEFGVVVTDDAPAGLESGSHWVRGDGSVACPEKHPIKGNTSSRIYHLPGEPSYERTIAEICFATEEDAQLAGFRARAK
jgi:hypothetical protein